MKNITLKQGQKWLQKMKDNNPSAYRQIIKCLRRYDKTNNQYECFIKMNETLYSLPACTQQINQYMDIGNKFAINYPLKQRFNSFLTIVKATKQQLFREIMQYGSTLSTYNHINNNNENNQIQNVIKNQIIQIVKKYPNLVSEAQKTFYTNQQAAIKNLPLAHLKNKGNAVSQQKNNEQSKIQKVVEKVQPVKNNKKYPIYLKQIEIQKNLKELPVRPKITLFSFLTTSQQKLFIKQLQKKISANLYKQLIKIFMLYSLNIISHLEFMQLVKGTVGADIEGLTDITESRDISRRRNSLFKPLSDIDFHILPRETHSYVEMPATYPHSAKNRPSSMSSILNNQWVSVPRGSEETFNVRVKNMYEMALNKFQDERYQFDVVIVKFRKTKQILQSISNELQINSKANITSQLNTVISLGVIQIIYKNATKEQKQIFQEAVDNNLQSLTSIWLQRVKKTLEELQQTRKLYGMKLWVDVSTKNFNKSLDFKNHEFKRFQKIKIRAQSFINQLNERTQYLESREIKKIYSHSLFQQKKQFFSVLNTFQTYSRKERCFHRKLPKPVIYNIKEHPLPMLLPAMILAFEDDSALKMVCTYVFFYIEFAINNQMEKSRCKSAFKQIMSEFFNINSFTLHCLNSSFNQQKLFNEQLLLQKSTSNFTKIQDWINVSYETDNRNEMANEHCQKIPIFYSMQNSPKQYSFQPPKSDNNLVFYSSENFYVFLRFFYVLYERIIRMKEISQSQRKIQLFQILYFACIKAKQNSRFEDALNILYRGKGSAYLLTTIHKVVEGLCKTLNAIFLSPVQSRSFQLLSVKNQSIFLLLLNRYMLNFSSNVPRLVRFTYQFDTRLLYINSLSPYYKFNEDNYKQYNKKLLQLSRNIQIYSADPSQVVSLPKLGKQTTQNNQQYYFQNNSYKLVNIANFQDIVMGERKPSGMKMQKQLKKLKKFHGCFKII